MSFIILEKWKTYFLLKSKKFSFYSISKTSFVLTYIVFIVILGLVLISGPYSFPQSGTPPKAVATVKRELYIFYFIFLSESL